MSADMGRELREFIRRLTVNQDRITSLERSAAALRTGIRDLWASAGSGGVAVTNVSLNCRGGKVNPAATSTSSNYYRAPAGAVVAVRDHTSGFLYLSATAPGGTEFVTGSIAAPSGSYPVNVTATPPSVRFTTPATVSTTYPLVGGNLSSDATSDGYLHPASGYSNCGLCDLPVANSLLLNDTSTGTVGAALTNAGGGTPFSTQWSATVGTTTYHLKPPDPNNGYALQLTISGVDHNYHVSDITSQTDPSDAGPVKFSVTFAVTGGSVTIYEP